MNIKKIITGGAATALLLSNIVRPAIAAGTNLSFETGTNPGSFSTEASGSTDISGWDVASGSVDYIGTYWDAAEGNRSVDLSGNEPGSISQTITTVVDAEYTVTFALSGNPDGGENIKDVEVSVNDGDAENFDFDKSAIVDKATDMMWTDKVYTFTATSTSTVLKFKSLETDAFGPVIDHIRIVEELPVTPTPTENPTPTPDPFAAPAECTGEYGAPIIGTAGSDILNGTNEDDLIFALGGSDVVNGKNGNDCIVGGAGSDHLVGGNGADVILGGADSDSIIGNDGADKLYGEAGSDALKGGNQADSLWGGTGSDALQGEGGNDTLIGGSESDAANGNGGTDACEAEAETSCEQNPV